MVIIEDILTGGAIAALVALTLWIEPGQEIEPAITSEAHRQWVAEQCARTTDGAALEQCKRFLEAK